MLSAHAPIPRHAGRRLAIALAGTLVALAALASSALGAARFEPPDGQVISGVAADYPASNAAKFAAMTNQPNVAIYARYTGGYLEDFGPILDDIRSSNSAGMISWRMFASSGAGSSHASIANGDIDAYLMRQAAHAKAFGRPLFLRPNWEMTGDWFPWSTYNGSCTQRSGNSPAQYRQSWQRARIIFEGGTAQLVNERLAAVGLPSLSVSASTLPSATNVAWVWSVSKGGVKCADRPHDTADYYPGDAYVDWVGMTFHQYGDKTLGFFLNETSNAKDPLARANDLYNEFSVKHGKPFMLGEWAVASRPLGNGDNPQYIRDMFAWIASHPKIKAQVYFNRVPSPVTHRLDDHPKAKAAFTELVNVTHPIYNYQQMSTGAPLVLPTAPALAPRQPAKATTPSKTTKGTGGGAGGGNSPAGGGPGAAPGLVCSAVGVTGVVPATGKGVTVARFAGRRLLVRVRATKTSVRGTVVMKGGRRPAGLVVRVRGDAAGVARKAPRKWSFGSALTTKRSSHLITLVVRGANGKVVERLRIRIATTKAAVKQSPPVTVCGPAAASAASVSGVVNLRPRVKGALLRVRSLRLFVDGKARTSWRLDTATLTPGPHEIRIVAVDGAGRKATVVHTITVAPPA